MRILAGILSLIVLLAPGSAAQTQLKPVPMNPGPLGPAGGIVLLPIDDRPAVGQFAQMVGAVADHRVVMPPMEMLGRFTVPGDTRRIENWLRYQDYSKVDALIVSHDMLAYGGLVASRRHGVPLEEARKRLEFYRWFKKKYPKVPLYVFSTVMRVAPTATNETRGLHDDLARWAELKDRVPKTPDEGLKKELDALTAKIPAKVIEDYLAARKRNLELNLALLDLVREGAIDNLIMLQDDARQYGLHRQDQAVLRSKLASLGLEKSVPIYNGADEGSISLVSRAVLDKFGRKLRVSVVYSSEKSRGVIAPYEDHPIQFTVESQIRAAGGIPVGDREEADYRLFVNAPETTEAEFRAFLARMIGELKEVRHIALADLLFPAPHFSGADERIIEALRKEGLIDRFAGYAAWNTAGNTLGTAIPYANMRVFFRTKLNDRADRAARAEIAHLEFLLHRYAGDYIYHDLVRQKINDRLREEARNDGTVTYELPPDKYERVNREVSETMKPLIEKFFADHFQGRTYKLGNYNGVSRTVTPTALRDLKVYLPWSRTFESVIEYRMNYETDRKQ